MKPWLLNILACPIDKHHPLDAYVFRWETSAQEIKELMAGAAQTTDELMKKHRQLAKQLTDGTISPPAIDKILDKSGAQDAADMLAAAKEKIAQLEGKTQEQLMEEHKDDVAAIYRYLNMMEVDVGLLVCPECGRWYPIGSAVETIPEMLPDDLREKERDLGWLEEWRQLVPGDVIKEGKPYSLS
ncbi:hypothetical protein E2P65_05715 [Candidatus Bathyarchaeota archaeon]|nr:hypothetical protein E2P65_05715 [Candidatus Bathyarchaeota archaeon]